MPSYEKNKDSGLWSCRFRYADENGVTRQKRLSGFKTKKDAQYGYEDYIAEQKRAEDKKTALQPIAAKPDDIRFSALYDKFIVYKAQRVKESSLYDLTKKYKTRILPFFADRKLCDITPATVLEWMATLDGFSYAYRSKLQALLTEVYIYANKYHDIPNIMTKVDKPRNLEPKKEMQVWSPKEFSQFISKVRNEEHALFFTFLYLTGCRRGEALALAWPDIDFEEGTISISKSLTNKAHDEGKTYAITTPKTAGSNRVIVIPQALREQLQKHRVKQSKECTSAEFVFGADKPLPTTSLERAMTKAAEDAGVKRLRMHDLRHSCASLLIHKGVSIVAVSRHLGHKNVEQTLNTYSHMMPDDKTMILKSLNSVSALLKN